MNEIFGEMNCKFGSDSIMMKLLKSSMDKAHERLKSKDGPIERLNEKSKFYELAIIQLEGSLKLVQEETDSYILENSHEILSDLMEIKDRLRGRLNDTELAIVRKDEELKERLENEFKLRQALDVKERGLVSLGVDIVDEKRNNEGVQEVFEAKQASGNEDKDGDIGELKFSVDQQVWNIKQKLEDERMNLTNDMRKWSFAPSSWRPDHENKDMEANGDDGFEVESLNVSLRPEQNMVIERVSSDIDILKGTLDLAFETMQKAEVLPLEKQWRCTIEKDTISILIRGFMGDFQQNFEGELSKRANHGPVGLLDSVHWPALINEMTSLRRELEALLGHNEVQVKKAKGNDSAGLPPRIQRANSEPLPDVDYMEDHNVEDSAEERSHYVAKMVKNHESIIRKQCEELHWLKREILREKGLSGKRDKDPNGLERRIQEVIQRLDNVVQWNAVIGNRKGLYENYISREKKKSKNDFAGEMEMSACTPTSVCEKRENVMVSHGLDDLHLQTMIMEETYITLLKGLMRDSYLELCDYDTMNMIRDDIFLLLFREMINEWYILKGSEERAKNAESPINFASFIGNIKCASNLSETTMKKSSLKQNEDLMFHREMEHLIREEIYQFVVVEAVKDANIFLRERQSMDDDKRVGINSLLRCFEVEEDLMRSAISEIKEHNAQHELEGMECEERATIEWLLKEEVSTFSSVSGKIEKALQQLIKSKTVMKDLGCSLGISVGDLKNVDNKINPNMGISDGKKNPSASAIFPFPLGFSKVVLDFDHMVQEKLSIHYLRLEKMKNQVCQIVQAVPLLRKRELIYREAFVRRCQNLQLAETEVDLLGDQVEALLGLLEKVHLILDQHSPILSRYFRVSDILKLIKKELSHGASYKIN